MGINKLIKLSLLGFFILLYCQLSFVNCQFVVRSAYALTPQEQAILNQQKLFHQQEQQRQFEQNRQNIDETQNIRDSRAREGIVEENAVAPTKVIRNKCDVGYDECVGKCEKSLTHAHLPEGEGASPKNQCVADCTQVKKDCVEELESACLHRFNNIVLRGNEIYSTETLNKKIINGYLNRCINRTNVSEIQTKITNFYIGKGYTMARVYFDMDNVVFEKGKNEQTGKEELKTTFVVVVEEGKVNDITLNVLRKQKPTKKEKEMMKLYGRYKELKEKESTPEVQNEINTLEPQLEQLAREVKMEAVKKEQKPLSKWTKSRRAMQTAFAFPFRSGRVYRMKDYEQGLDQMNRLQSNSVTMDVRPVAQAEGGKQKPKEQHLYGLSDVILVNNQDPTKDGVSTGGRTTFLTVGYNNSGNKSTGENVINLSLSQDNLISINDNIYLSYTETSNSMFLTSSNKVDNPGDPASKNPFKNNLDYMGNDDEKQKYNKSIYSSISLPVGYWTINGSLNYSTYKTTNSGLFTTFHTTGQTTTQTYSLDRVMYRTQKYKLNVGAQLEVRDTESYIRDLKSETGSRKTTNGSLYINNTLYTKLGTIIVKPTYQRGLRLFSAKMDESVYGATDIFRNEPKLQYDLLKLYLYYNTRVNVPLMTKTQVQNKDGTNAKDEKGEDIKVRNKLPISYTLTVDSQYSFDTLYGTDQFSVGGEYTVRGFRESTISGDSGFYVRNDLRINLFQLFPKAFTNNKPMNYSSILLAKESMNSLLSKTYFSIFYDYGYVKNKYSNSSDAIYNSASGDLSGFGVGLNYYGKYLNWSLTYSKSLHSPTYLQTRDGLEKENHSIYWRVGASW